MDIFHIIMGGTIDSSYDVTKDTVVPLAHSVIPEYIGIIKPYFGYESRVLCMKDSRSITNEDRYKLVDIIEGATPEYILITHGTYTMPDTARFLEKHITEANKIVILTGSMIPIKGFSPSDAGFNLGFAIASFPSLKSGVYVAMNGRIFMPSEVIKTLEEGKFSSISET